MALTGILDLMARRCARALAEIPTANTWLMMAVIFAITAITCFYIGSRTGFLRRKSVALTLRNLLVYGIVTLIAPSFVEEMVYRVMLLPGPREHIAVSGQIALIVLSLVLFVVAHPVRFWLMPTPRNRTFADPTFLVLATALGCGCTVAYLTSHSVWPSLLIHYFCVVGWLLFFGGADRLCR